MIRPALETEERCCPTCGRDGYKVRKRYTLQTREEYLELGRRLYPDDKEEQGYRMSEARHIFKSPPNTPFDALVVRTVGGCLWSEAFHEAKALAVDTKRDVVFTFNDVPCVITPEIDAAEAWYRYRKGLNPNWEPRDDE